MEKFYRKSTQEVYEYYVEKCKSMGREPVSKNKFVRAFLRENPEYKVSVIRIGDTAMRGFLRKYQERITDFLWD